MKYFVYLICLIVICLAAISFWKSQQPVTPILLPIEEFKNTDEEVAKQPTTDETAEAEEVVVSYEASTTTQDVVYCDTLSVSANNAGSPTFFVSELTDGNTIQSGDVLRGCIIAQAGSYGNWGPFEGQIGTFEITASDGTVLDTGLVPVSGYAIPDWLNVALAGDPIPFETAPINFVAGSYASGTIIFNNENPSGESANNASSTYSINF